METILFTDTFKKTFKKALKIQKITIDDPIFRLHYKFTGFALLFASMMVSIYQFFGDPIMCIQRDDIPESLLNTYCWIEGTFTLPKALSKKVGEQVVYPGVDTYYEGDELTHHAYYQWVGFVLILQALMFCVPYIIWKAIENGRMKAFVEDLNEIFITKEEERRKIYNNVACYFQHHKSKLNRYFLKYVFCELLNFIHVIGQIYFIDKFLGGEFTKYGVEVLGYVNDDQQNRTDPMIRIFPRITKCTFHKYGSSGSVQKHDALCLLPLNILNEKLFVVIWFWFVILAVLGGTLLLYRFILMFSKEAKYMVLHGVASLSPKDEIKSLIQDMNYDQWFMMYLLADNIDSVHFQAIVAKLNEKEPLSIQDESLDETDNGENTSGKEETDALLYETKDSQV